MEECRFEGKDWQGDEYTCRTHKGENPALCTHAAAALEQRVEEAEVAHQIADSFWVALKPLNLPAINVENPGIHVIELVARLARLEEEKARLRIEVSKSWDAVEMAKCDLSQAEAINIAHIARIQHLSAEVARYMGEQRVREAEAREAAMREALEVLMGASGLDPRAGAMLQATAALPPVAGRAPGNINEVLDSISDRVALQPDTFTKARVALDDYRLLAAEVEKLREVEKAADKVIADWEASCRDYPVDYAKPQTLHPFGPAIGWQSLHGLRDALAKRGE